MKHWVIDVTNAEDYSFKERLPRIKALRLILVDLGIGDLKQALKQAKEFICGEESFKVYSMNQAARIIAFCDEHGLVISIKVKTSRFVTPEEWKRLEAG